VNERTIRQMVEDAGLAVLSIAKSKHIKVRVRAADGREGLQVFPSSPGKGCAEQNRRAELRRFARGGA
jgi:hypothetical protein